MKKTDGHPAETPDGIRKSFALFSGMLLKIDADGCRKKDADPKIAAVGDGKAGHTGTGKIGLSLFSSADPGKRPRQGRPEARR